MLRSLLLRCSGPVSVRATPGRVLSTVVPSWRPTSQQQRRRYSTTEQQPAHDNHHAYSDSLNLPKTNFSLRTNAAQREPLLRTRCCDFAYQWQVRPRPAPARVSISHDAEAVSHLAHDEQLARKNPKTFVLHDGPPYANGPLHTGT